MRRYCFYIEPWFGAGVGLAECLGRRSTFFENEEGNLVDGERYRNTNRRYGSGKHAVSTRRRAKQLISCGKIFLPTSFLATANRIGYRDVEIDMCDFFLWRLWNLEFVLTSSKQLLSPRRIFGMIGEIGAQLYERVIKNFVDKGRLWQKIHGGGHIYVPCFTEDSVLCNKVKLFAIS